MAAPDNSTTGTSYSANCATLTDQQSHARKICTDALGRMYQVTEDPGGLSGNEDTLAKPASAGGIEGVT